MFNASPTKQGYKSKTSVIVAGCFSGNLYMGEKNAEMIHEKVADKPCQLISGVTTV